MTTAGPQTAAHAHPSSHDMPDDDSATLACWDDFWLPMFTAERVDVSAVPVAVKRELYDYHTLLRNATLGDWLTTAAGAKMLGAGA